MKKSASVPALALLLLGVLFFVQPFSVARAEETGQTAFVPSQASDEVLASSLIGAPVENAEKEKLGSIKDLVFDANGRVVTAVIGVGGFAGLGQKNVAVAFDALEKQKGANGSVVMLLKVSKQALNDAPVYRQIEDRSLTEKLQEWGQQAKEKAVEYGQKAREKANEYSEKAKEAYEKAKEQNSSPDKDSGTAK